MCTSSFDAIILHYSMSAEGIRRSVWNAMQGLGICFAVSGALVMLDVTHIDLHSTQTVGMLVMLVQVFSYSVFIVALAEYLKQVPRPFSVFCRASTVGAAALAMIAAREAQAVEWSQVPTVAWVILLYCALGVSFVAHSSVSWAVQHVSATVPSLYACLQPAAVTIMSWLVYGDVLGWVELVGMFLIVTGLFVTVAAPPVHPDGVAPKAVASSEESHLIHEVQLYEDVLPSTLETVSQGPCVQPESLESQDGALSVVEEQ